MNSELKPLQKDWKVTLKVLRRRKSGEEEAVSVSNESELSETLQITNYFDSTGQFSRIAFDASICKLWSHFIDLAHKKHR